jgi:hypothetical protein
MSNKRKDFQTISKRYVNIGLYPETHRALVLMAGKQSFDSFVKKSLRHLAMCENEAIDIEDRLTHLDKKTLNGLLRKELKINN